MKPKLLRKSSQKLDRPRGAAKGLLGGAKCGRRGAKGSPRASQERAKSEPVGFRGNQVSPTRGRGGAKWAQEGAAGAQGDGLEEPREPKMVASHLLES